MSQGQTIENYIADCFPKSSLSRKVLRDVNAIRNNVGDVWETLTDDDKEALIDSHFTNFDSKERVTVFPVYKISCGEKIIVDFDNEVFSIKVQSIIRSIKKFSVKFELN